MKAYKNKTSNESSVVRCAEGPANFSRERMLLFLWAFCVLTFIHPRSSCVESIVLSDIVQTTKGPVQGEIRQSRWYNNSYAAYRGIRYGKSTAGPGRFKAPIEADPWTDVYLATEERDKCAQIDFVFNNFTGSEDCLFLNVYTPLMCGNGSKSVMVWIYGGTFKRGYKDMALYGPDYFIDNCVILVTLNYRLGAFGFLALGLLDAAGNQGIKDQLMALKWVRDNIEAFSGDKNRITLAGQSAGGVSVDIHVLSPQSKGLFTQTISQSASPKALWGYQSPGLAQANAFELGAKLGHITEDKMDLLNFLKQAPVAAIVNATESYNSPLPPFAVTTEPDNITRNTPILTECPDKIYSSGNFPRMNHLIGYTKHEANLFAKSLADAVVYISSVFDIGEKIGLNSLLDPITNRLKDVTMQTVQVPLDVVSDMLFVAPINQKQNAYNKRNCTTYFYRLDYTSKYDLHFVQNQVPLNGTAHGDDIGHEFYQPVFPTIPTDPTDPLSQFNMKMVYMWANFVKFGNPTPPNGAPDAINYKIDAIWTPSGESGRQLNIDTKFEMGDNLASPSAKAFEVALEPITPVTMGCQGILESIVDWLL